MKLRYQIGIATKIILMVTALVIASIGVVVYIASDLFQEDSVTRIQESNKETAGHLGERVQSVFEDSYNRLTLMAQFATKSASKEEAVRAIANTLGSADDIVSFVAYQVNENGQFVNMYTVALDNVLAELNLNIDSLRDKPRDYIFLEQLKDLEKVNVVNSAPFLKVPLFTMSFVSKDSKDIKSIPANLSNQDKLKMMNGRWFFRADIRHDPILKLFSDKKFHLSYLVDRTGKLLAHSNPDYLESVITGLDLSSNPIVWKLVEGQVDNQQMEYIGDDEEVYLGAYKKLNISGIGVVTEVKKNQALATINRVQYRSFLVMVIVVCLAIVFNFLFSQSLTSPIKKLFEATEKIVEGNYNVDLKASSKDEIGALSNAFINMTEGLKEREKLKGAFAKFHSKEVAKKLLSGEIKLGGERKRCTVFFSDIRGFTSMSEKMTPDQVVAMLNEYMTEMVKIIYKWNGVVDKYVGDAIMAEWGVPNNTPDDPYNAMRAALEMRAFMIEFNKKRVVEGKDPINIGIGLHSGDVLAGNIGSEERLEYTVIGDAVNQASRIEAATKILETDLLISESTYTLVKERGIIVGPVMKIKVKGKSDLLHVYKVIGFLNEKQELQTVLSKEQIEVINNQSDTIVSQDEVKVESQPVNLNSSEPTLNIVASQPDKNLKEGETEWFVVDHFNPQDVQGPFSMDQIIIKAKNLQLDIGKMHVFKQGDSETTPLWMLPGMQRKPLPKITAPIPGPEYQEGLKPGDWYVYGQNGTVLGPVTDSQLWLALDNGNLTRTTWVWSLGYNNWIYLFQVPGFDRRNEQQSA